MKASCQDLGRMDYKACWDLQQELFDARVARKRTGSIPVPGTDGDPDDAGTVLLVEHPPVFTLGKSGHAENLLVNQEALEAMGAQFFHIDRGGDITFHGPGQLVCYPILDLERLGIGLREYIEALEEAVIRTVAEYGIAAGRIAGASGVWIDHARVRAERDDRPSVVLAHQPLRIHRPGRHVDRRRNGIAAADAGGEADGYQDIGHGAAMRNRGGSLNCAAGKRPSEAKAISLPEGG